MVKSSRLARAATPRSGAAAAVALRGRPGEPHAGRRWLFCTAFHDCCSPSVVVPRQRLAAPTKQAARYRGSATAASLDVRYYQTLSKMVVDSVTFFHPGSPGAALQRAGGINGNVSQDPPRTDDVSAIRHLGFVVRDHQYLFDADAPFFRHAGGRGVRDGLGRFAGVAVLRRPRRRPVLRDRAGDERVV